MNEKWIFGVAAFTGAMLGSGVRGIVVKAAEKRKHQPGLSEKLETYRRQLFLDGQQTYNYYIGLKEDLRTEAIQNAKSENRQLS